MELVTDKALEKDWEAVGSYLRQAIEEVAAEISDIAVEHVLGIMGEEILPCPEALIYLEGLDPGAADWVITRSAEIQRETHEREWAEANSFRHRAEAFGRGMLWLT